MEIDDAIKILKENEGKFALGDEFLSAYHMAIQSLIS